MYKKTYCRAAPSRNDHMYMYVRDFRPSATNNVFVEHIHKLYIQCGVEMTLHKRL